MNKNREPAPQQKTLKLRGLIIFALSVAAEIGIYALGIGISGVIGEDAAEGPASIALLSCFVLAILTGVAAGVLMKKYGKALSGQRVEEVMRIRKEQMSDTEKSAAEVKAKLEKCRRLTGVYTAYLLVLGFAAPFFAGLDIKALASAGMTPIITILLASQLVSTALCRIFASVPEPDMKKIDTYLPEEEYPALYAAAKKAAHDSGCGEDLRICLIADNNVGVGVYKSFILLQIGVPYLYDNGEAELYAILLHEFSHVISGKTDKEAAYNDKITAGLPDPGFFAPLKGLFYGFSDIYYIFNYMQYSLIANVKREAEADRAMAAPEYREAAASSLIKLFFRDRYEWEDGSYDYEPYFASETVPERPASAAQEDYEKRKAERAGFWLSLIPKEIISMSASHPTLKMRLDALGVTEYKPLDDPGSPEFCKERAKAMDKINALISESLKERYAEARREHYSDRLEAVRKWKDEGEPVEAEKYRDVIDALRSVGKVSEAEALCGRAIEQLPDVAALYAYFIRGLLRLHRYDGAGIEDLYHAAENNSNFVDESLETIGRFCCAVGDRAELDRYRERCVEFGQKDQDVYSKMSVITKNDDLSEEHLPEGMLDKILECIRASDDGTLDAVYLVHKQITQNDAVSIFILRYKEGVTVSGDVYDKIFRHLDTEYEWQFSLLESGDVPMNKITAVPGSLVYRGEAENK